MFVEILNKYGNTFVSKLKEAHLQAGQKASGQTLSEFQYETTDTTLKVFGADHIEYLDRGRGAGGFPSPLVKDDYKTGLIYKWSIAKGINFDSESERRSFAFVVTRKIIEEGTFQHRAKGATWDGTQNPVSRVFNKETMGELREELAKIFMENEFLQINKIFEKWQFKS